MIPLLRLGVRLSWGAGRSGRSRLVLMASGSAVAAFVVLTALSLSGLADRQSDREVRIAPQAVNRLIPEATLQGTVMGDGWDGKELRRIVLAVEGPNAPVPPGLDRLPGPGEVALSPELERLVASEPLVAERFPQRRVATIADDGLVEPRQLLAYVGMADASRIWMPSDIDGWGDAEAVAVLDPRAARTVSLLVLLTLVAPVVMFLATCTRLSATARSQRLAALRLLGLSPRRTQLVSAVETGLVGTAGNIVGLGAWLAWRQLDRTVQVGSFGWYSSDLWLPPPRQALVIAVLVALAVVVGLFGGHAGVARPLETRRERSARSVSPWRAVPLLLGISLLGWSWTTSDQTGPGFMAWLVPFGIGLVGTSVGLVLVVPFAARALGAVLGRSSRPTAILAGARLRHEPVVAGRVVSALAIALFAAAFAQVVLTNVNAAYAGTSENEIGSVLTMTAHGTTTDNAAYQATSSLGIALPKGPIGRTEPLASVAATCEELEVATGHAVAGCRDGRTYRVASVRTSVPGLTGPAADREPSRRSRESVDRTLVEAGLPATAGDIHLTFSTINYSFVADVVVPPSSAPPTTNFVVPFAGRTWDPQVAVARLATLDPGASWDRGITGVDRLDSARIYSGIVAVGTVSALVVALGALVVATVDRTIERAGAQARMAAMGTPARTLRAALVLQTLPVAVLVLVCSGLAAILGGSSYLRFGDPSLRVPLGVISALTGLAVAAALLATIAALVGTVTRPRPELLRVE